MRTLKLSILFLAMYAVAVHSQDLATYKRIVKQLSSASYQGRGYARGGANKAGVYLEREYRRAGVDEVIRQPFTLDINTFPGKMQLSADGRQLLAGRDFTVREFCPSVKGEYVLYHVDTLNYSSERLFGDLSKPEYQGAMVVCDFWFSYKHREDFSRLQKSGECNNAGIIYTWETPLKFYKAYGERVAEKPIIWTLAECIRGAKRVKANIENRFFKDYECFNVIAKVSGQRHDSCYVFTAHYDHIGNLGRKVYYGGANDNASGTAMLVTLASYYTERLPPFDIYFIAFSGEDANLRGSNWFADHPTLPLNRIKYLLNIDMIGDNNAELYCETSDTGDAAFGIFEDIIREKKYFASLNHGQLAANSDHYPFAVRHIPCIFLENKEGDAFPYYHTPQDDWRHAVVESYEPLFKLVTTFVEKYSNEGR